VSLIKLIFHFLEVNYTEHWEYAEILYKKISASKTPAKTVLPYIREPDG
jgi:hypothetical protein